MKKLTPLLLAVFLLAGCFGGSGPADDSETTDESSQVTITENDFVAISAEILCLPQNFPNATAKEIEAKAQTIAEQYGASTEAYQAFEKILTAEQTEKTRIGYAIIGKMGEFCEVGGVAEDEDAEEAAAAEAEEGAESAESSETETAEPESSEAAEDTEAAENTETPAEAAATTEEAETPLFAEPDADAVESSDAGADVAGTDEVEETVESTETVPATE